jgi:hypothetical protein
MMQVPEDVHRGGDPWRLACIARESFIRRGREDSEEKMSDGTTER